MAWKGPRTLDVTLPEEHARDGRQRPRRDVPIHRRGPSAARQDPSAKSARWSGSEHMGPEIVRGQIGQSTQAKVAAGKVDKLGPGRRCWCRPCSRRTLCSGLRSCARSTARRYTDEDLRGLGRRRAHSGRRPARGAGDDPGERRQARGRRTKQGEGSGGSSDTSSGPKPVPDEERTEPPADCHILIAARRLKIGSIREAAGLVGERITPKTYRRLMEYLTLMDIHQAETQAADMKDRQQAADLSQRASADAPDAWDLYWRVRMGID